MGYETVAEKMIMGGSVALIGMGIVFLVLMLLWGILEVMHIVFGPKKEEKPLIQPELVQAPTPILTEAADLVDDSKLVAVITAAIASSLNTSNYNLQIKSIKRVHNWNK